jgi:hypothetical protein
MRLPNVGQTMNYSEAFSKTSLSVFYVSLFMSLKIRTSLIFHKKLRTKERKEKNPHALGNTITRRRDGGDGGDEAIPPSIQSEGLSQRPI